MKLNDSTIKASFRPVDRVNEVQAYRRKQPLMPIDLNLDGNEGAGPESGTLVSEMLTDAEVIRRYPDASRLEALIGDRFGLDADRVIVTAGGDEAIDRICRLALEPGRSIVFPTPTFEMIETYARLAGAELRPIDWWTGAFPAQAVLDAVDESTAVVAVVSPNNPTGLTATANEIRQVAQATPQAVILVDFAYIEFADDDPSIALLSIPNIAIVRTLSKAYGLAGLRVGFTLGDRAIIDTMRRTGGPYPVSSLSLRLAEHVLKQPEDSTAYVSAARAGRDKLVTLLRHYDIDALNSQGNFVFGRSPRSQWLAEGLASLGIAIRTFPRQPELEDAVRITVPPQTSLERLVAAIQITLDPQAVLFDMDGVLADVSQSYRQAIIETARQFGVVITREDVAARKTAGKANNDWDLTVSLLAERGVEVERADVVSMFEHIYQGSPSSPGLWRRERLLGERDWLLRLKQRIPLGIVTGRPRADAMRFLDQHDLIDIFDTIVCMEDAPPKPSPEPVLLALRQLGIDRAWLIGDTPDDMSAARSAGVLPLGILAPGDTGEATDALQTAGTGKILNDLVDLEEILP